MGQPLWLQAFNAVEGVVGSRVEELVHGERFTSAVVLLHKVKGGVSGIVERRSRGVWHLVNLPAGSDVRRLRTQVGDLDHEVRQLRGALEREARLRARTSRRRAQGGGEGDE